MGGAGGGEAERRSGRCIEREEKREQQMEEEEKGKAKQRRNKGAFLLPLAHLLSLDWLHFLQQSRCFPKADNCGKYFSGIGPTSYSFGP